MIIYIAGNTLTIGFEKMVLEAKRERDCSLSFI